MIGYLKAKSILGPAKQVREAMRRVDLEEVLLRSLGTAQQNIDHLLLTT